MIDILLKLYIASLLLWVATMVAEVLVESIRRFWGR